MAIFVKFEGIEGESYDANHVKWIDVLSLDWGIHKRDPGLQGQSRRRSAPVVEDLMLTMAYEKAAPKLMEKCLKGEVIPKLEIEFTATYGGTQATYLRWIMEEVIISSFQTNASGNNEAGPPTVVIGNNFEEIKMTYTEYDRERKSKGNVEVEFRVENGK
jgi:type VI secretion system secreted protein Hcp